MNTHLESARPGRLRRILGFLTVGALTTALLAGLVSTNRAQDRVQGPDLVGGLKATKGCLGVETAETGSGKQVIFAWFENRKACLRWYYSDMHQAMMDMVFTDEVLEGGHGEARKPLQGVPENYDGPILAIASLTYSRGKKGLDGLNMPISQIAIELYMPLTGGLHMGGRFAPETMKIPGTMDYAKKNKGEW